MNLMPIQNAKCLTIVKLSDVCSTLPVSGSMYIASALIGRVHLVSITEKRKELNSINCIIMLIVNLIKTIHSLAS